MSFEKDLKQALSDYEQSLVDYYNELPDPKRRKKDEGKKKLVYSFCLASSCPGAFCWIKRNTSWNEEFSER